MACNIATTLNRIARAFVGDRVKKMVQPKREPTSRRPVLIGNPTHDDAFIALAERLIGEGLTTPEELETELRRSYPRAVVRQRELAAELTPMWYAYRDGRWVDSRDDRGL